MAGLWSVDLLKYETVSQKHWLPEVGFAYAANSERKEYEILLGLRWTAANPIWPAVRKTRIAAGWVTFQVTHDGFSWKNRLPIEARFD